MSDAAKPFLVLATPRSGSAWLANLLNTEDHPVAHDLSEDPRFWHDPEEIFNQPYFGFVDTGIHFRSPDVWNNKVSKVVTLVRDRPSLIASLSNCFEELARKEIEWFTDECLSRVESINADFTITYDEMFNNREKLESLYAFLTGKNPNRERLNQLLRMNVQVDSLVRRRKG
jgi:hypothetical protein